MSEISSYEAQVKKMQGLCEEHNLVYRFRKERYPMTFTIKPSHAMDAQMSMLENAEDEGYISPEASMTWIFNDGVLETKVRGGTFTISKTTHTKIENILIKMITFWQQYFFRCVIENRMLPEKQIPTFDDEELWPDDAEMFGDDDGEGEDDADSSEPPNDSAEDNTEGGDIDGEGESAAPGNEDDPPDVEHSGSSKDALSGLDEQEINEATRIVRAANRASCALLQRQMNIKGSKAARLLDALEALGVIGPYNGSQPREVLPYDEPEDEEGVSE